ncbi:alkane hydroxylase MAH1-like isoform X2 [Quercus robur]|uniref:alkane hydroxylase MAH1-like isoform X2 n=1 Tax=Quercus robur TaxID=38942 RepID=UPI0021621EFD|nr:alkane hydroxylase MAH1-like isoform X2 [Quercus robur]
MTILLYPEILVAIFLCFLFLCHLRWNKSRTITNWPVVGMLPGLLQNASNVHEYITWLLKQNGGIFKFKGPWFTNMTFMVTSDPRNIHHMLSKDFSNYTKGQKFQEIFDVLGGGIFNSDSDSWTYQRKLLHTVLKDNKFKLFFEQFVKGKVEKSLIPVLDHVSSFGIEVDLQDIFQRFTFDTACLVVLGFDPNCLSIEFPDVSHAKAFDQIEECLLYRHIVPESCWKLQRWLQIGIEKKLSSAWKIFDQFIYRCISSRPEELSQSKAPKTEEEKFDLLTALGEQVEEIGGIIKSDKFLRDTAFNLMVAGRDTISAGLTWLFWIVATHPHVEAKILEEIKEHLLDNGKWKDFNIDEISKLVYLHGVICESLRLYPPVPFEHKCSVQFDILPSGHSIRPNTTMLCSLYSMGRMESIWGQDYMDFKPERWISERGRILHTPSFKFIAFNAGPRTCIGKDIAFIQMKIIASAIIWNYHVHVVEGHPVSPSISILLHMKHGLKVRISKRNV